MLFEGSLLSALMFDVYSFLYLLVISYVWFGCIQFANKLCLISFGFH